MQIICNWGIPLPMKVKACKHETHQGKGAKRLESALGKLRSSGLRVTLPRKEILAVLAKTQRPLSSEEVFSQIEKNSDLVTVYRSLAALEEAGLVHRYDFGDSVRRYDLSDEGHHHHYIRCRSCGDLEAFDGCEFEEKLSKILEKKGYRMIHHSLDVQALCSSCSS